MDFTDISHKQWKNIGVTIVSRLCIMAIDAYLPSFARRVKVCFVSPIYAFGCFSYLLILPLFMGWRGTTEANSHALNRLCKRSLIAMLCGYHKDDIDYCIRAPGCDHCGCRSPYLSMLPLSLQPVVMCCVC